MGATRKYFIALLFFTSLFSFSQKLIFQELPEKILQPPLYGIKGKHFVHMFYEAGLPVGPGGADTFKTINKRSGNYNLGFRYKLKLGKRTAFISELSYRLKSHYMKQNGKRFPDTLHYKKEKYNFNQAALAVAARIIYGKKKRYFGNHFDAGASAAWNFSTTRYTKNEAEVPDAPYKKQVIRVREKKLSYAAPFELDAFISWGLEKLQFKLQYRITDNFRNYRGKALPEFSRFMLGLNIALIGE